MESGNKLSEEKEGKISNRKEGKNSDRKEGKNSDRKAEVYHLVISRISMHTLLHYLSKQMLRSKSCM